MRVLQGAGGTPGRVLVVDALGNGDYTTIQAAINAAYGQGPTAVNPWLVLVAPGSYQESLTLYDYVHVAGLAPNRAAYINVSGASAILNGATCTLANLRIAGDASPIVEVNTGTLRLRHVTIENDDPGVDGLSVSGGVVEVLESEVQAGGSALALSAGMARVYDSILRRYHTIAGAASEPAVEVSNGTLHVVRSVVENASPDGPALQFAGAPVEAKLLQSIFRKASGTYAIDAALAVSAVIAACLVNGSIHPNVSGLVSYTEDATI